MKTIEPRPDCAHWANVMLAISVGDLRPLAIHPRQGGGSIDPAVANRLADLIDGTAATSHFELRLVRNRRLPSPNSRGIERKREARKRNWAIADFMAAYRHGRKGLHEAARKEAAQRFGVSISIVNQAWAQNGKDAQSLHAAMEPWIKLKRAKMNRSSRDGQP